MDNPNNQNGWSNEFKVGLMTLVALMVLMVSILFVNNVRFGRSGQVYTATFTFLGDLKADAPVRYAGGIDVGQVKAIRFQEGKAAVDLLITQPGLKLRQDSQVAIYSTSMLGSKYVQIEADLGSGPELKPGEVLVGHDSNNLDKTFSQLGDVMESFEKMMGDPKAKESFLKSFENINKTTEQLLSLTISSRVKVEKMIDDLSKSSGDVSKIVSSAQKVSKNLEDLTGALKKKDIDLAVKNMSNTLKVMNQLANDIQSGKGAAGVLLKDEKVGEDIRTLVEELKAHPWKLLWKK